NANSSSPKFNFDNDNTMILVPENSFTPDAVDKNNGIRNKAGLLLFAFGAGTGFLSGTGFGSKLGLGSGLFIGLDGLSISFFEIFFIKSCKYFKSYKFLA
ncbi:hypothetical protein, partial [Mycoplasmopsis bovis]|uniref:hypothetical protein n=1 Tax=Mycoplasmopsis bovis TaxID=28903 RepID=UPI003D26FA9D